VAGEGASTKRAMDLVREDVRGVEHAPVRQLDIGPSAPIPGSTRERVQQQANRMLPGIVDDNGGKGERTIKARPVRNAWGEAASASGFALALSLRSRGLKWAVRVLTLVLWFIVPTPVSGLITLVWLVWGVVGVSAWVRRLSRSKKGVDTCQCRH